jgi:hypothetical protein
MTNTAAEQRKIVIRPGFSPKPAQAVTPVMASSPSGEPETTSPNALLDGPLIQRLAFAQTNAEIRAENGIISFGK